MTSLYKKRGLRVNVNMHSEWELKQDFCNILGIISQSSKDLLLATCLEESLQSSKDFLLLATCLEESQE